MTDWGIFWKSLQLSNPSIEPGTTWPFFLQISLFRAQASFEDAPQKRAVLEWAESFEGYDTGFLPRMIASKVGR